MLRAVAYCRRFRGGVGSGSPRLFLKSPGELTWNRTLCYHCKLIHIRPLRFVLIFACSLLIGFGVLITPQVQSVDGKFSRALVSVSQGLIRMCGGHVARDGAILRAPGGFAVEMRDGCNAVNVTILLCAAILAFPASWRMKAAGLLAGIAIIQVVNIIRFITLFLAASAFFFRLMTHQT